MNKHKGQSLVSLMVGILLGLLCIIVVFGVYKTIVLTTNENMLTSRRDSQILSSLMAIEYELSQAGWSIEPGEAGDNITVSSDGGQVTWRYRDGSLVCNGLKINGDGIALANPQPCTDSSDVLDWSTHHQLASSAIFHSQDGEVTLWDLNSAKFRLETKKCGVWGHDSGFYNDINTRKVLILENPSDIIFEFCLVNF